MNKANTKAKFCISIFLLIIHTFAQSQNSNTKAESYVSQKIEAIIFTLDTTKHSGCFDSKNFITPPKKNIDECEKLIQAKFKKIYEEYSKINGWKLTDENLSNYKLQIAAYIDKNGDEILFISGAHSTLEKTSIDYKKVFICHPIQLSNYCLECPNYTKIDWWGIKYNSRTKEFFDMIVFDPS